MKWLSFLTLFFLLCVLVVDVDAYDTAGKFGMGIRMWGTPIVTFSSIKYGASNKIGLEPSIGYYKWTTSYGDESDSESSNSTLLFSVIGDINAIEAERSNFLVRIGGLYAKTTSSYSYTGYESSTSTTGFAFLGGIGIEHFVNDNFAVNVGALSGFWTSNTVDSDASFSFMSINSQLVDFSLVWYLR